VCVNWKQISWCVVYRVPSSWSYATVSQAKSKLWMFFAIGWEHNLCGTIIVTGFAKRGLPTNPIL